MEEFLQKDDQGRLSGILPYNKPQGVGSHDIVYKVRRELNIKTVGHGGALDPFAEGLLLILVGRATKQFDSLLSLDKEYVAEVIFGVSSATLDPESSVKSDPNQVSHFSEDQIKKALESFLGEYNQRVPVFSSVKVQGRKLRQIVSSQKYEIEKRGGAHFLKFGNNELEIPVKKVNIYDIELIDLSEVSKSNLEIKFNEIRFKNKMLSNKTFADELKFENYQVAKIRIKASKGTYIRQIAEDLTARLDHRSSGILLSLVRTSIGDYHINRSIRL